MFCKTYLFVLLAAYFVQVFGAPNTSNEEVKKQLKELYQYTQEEINLGKVQLLSLQDIVVVKTNEYIQESTKNFTENVAKLTDKLINIKKETEAQGKDISDCLEGNEVDFELATNKLSFDLQTNIIALMREDEAVAYILSAQASLYSAFNYYRQIKSDFKKCETSKEDKCYDDVTARIEQVKLEIPNSVSDVVKDIPDKVLPILDQTKDDLWLSTYAFLVKASDAIYGIIKCINEQ